MKFGLINKIIIIISAIIIIFCFGFWTGYSNAKTTINVSVTQQTEESKPSSTNNALININTADAEELDLLPGIGPALANAIIEYRTENGNFEKIEDIMNVNGISLVVFRSIESLITV